MREMKDSGIEWIGEIPLNWKIVRVKDLYSFDAGFTPDTSCNDYYNDEDGYEWATIADINNGIINKPTSSLISRKYVKMTHRKAVPIGSLLYSFKLSVGQTAITDRSIFTNEAIATFYPKRDVNLKFLEYTSFLIEYNSNTNIYGAHILNQSLIGDAHIINPPLKEQNKITHYLEKQCNQIDDLTEKIQTQINLLEDYKKSVITEAVTKGLDSNVPMKDSGIEWAEKVPTHWDVMPNKYVMKKIKNICSKYNGEDIISLSVNGVIVRDLDAGGKMPATFDGYQYVYPDNLLMCLFDYDVTPRCIGLINDYGLTSPAYSQFEMENGNHSGYYYYYYLMIDNTKELLHLAKNLRHSFTEEQLGVIKTPVPPVEEQIVIAQYLDGKINEVDTMIKKEKNQLELLEDYKKSLIYEYVTGKKEVPSDE